MEYDFSGLTPAQHNLLTREGWVLSPETPRRPQRRVVNKLLERGLIVMRPLRPGGTDPMAYVVPIPVHIAWCQHCAGLAKRYGMV